MEIRTTTSWFLNINAYEQTAHRVVEVKRLLTGLIQKLTAEKLIALFRGLRGRIGCPKGNFLQRSPRKSLVQFLSRNAPMSDKPLPCRWNLAIPFRPSRGGSCS